MLKKLAGGSTIPKSDIDRLTAYVALSYCGQAKDEIALKRAEDVLERGGASFPQLCWIAGLASYRLGQFEHAARHFETVAQTGRGAARTYAAASFWAARSWMRAGAPERVVALYQRAASEPHTVYGLLASKLLRP